MTNNLSQTDQQTDLQAQIESAVAKGIRLKIVGGNTKNFYGNTAADTQNNTTDIHTSGHTGVIDYDPAELVITLRAGCKLKDIKALLAENNQMFGFEPPQFGDQATIGGIVASGLAGPRRAFSGAIRDFILGVKLINGRGEVVSFGGRVIKNVAGFDVSRLMVGALGTIGVLLEVSLRVIPRFETEATLIFEHADAQTHINWINQHRRLPHPISAAQWYQGQTKIRLSGSQQGVASASQLLGGDKDENATIWSELTQQTHSFFTENKTLARVSVPSVEPDFLTAEPQLLEWAGAQRWVNAPAEQLDALRHQAENHRGIVCAYKGYDKQTPAFQRPTDAIIALHRSLKSSFDPAGIFNPGRLYADF